MTIRTLMLVVAYLAMVLAVALETGGGTPATPEQAALLRRSIHNVPPDRP